MSNLLESYAPFVGENTLRHLRQLAAPLRGASVVHVNSTRAGGGVAEILHRLVPLQRELGLDASWQVIEGGRSLFRHHEELPQRAAGAAGRRPAGTARSLPRGQPGERGSARRRARRRRLRLHPRPAAGGAPALHRRSGAASGSGAVTSTPAGRSAPSGSSCATWWAATTPASSRSPPSRSYSLTPQYLDGAGHRSAVREKRRAAGERDRRCRRAFRPRARPPGSPPGFALRPLQGSGRRHPRLSHGARHTCPPSSCWPGSTASGRSRGRGSPGAGARGGRRGSGHLSSPAAARRPPNDQRPAAPRGRCAAKIVARGLRPHRHRGALEAPTGGRPATPAASRCRSSPTAPASSSTRRKAPPCASVSCCRTTLSPSRWARRAASTCARTSCSPASFAST